MIIKISEKQKEIVKPEDIYKILKSVLESEDLIDQDKEHFWVFHLDTRNKIKILELVSLGSLNMSIVHPREVFTRAVAERSSQILIAHNHPSDETSPSDDDLTLTKRLKQAGDILGIELIDHIIVSKNGFTSLKEKQII